MSVSDQDEAKLFRMMIYAIGTIIIVFFLTIGGCTMHGNAYEADVEKQMTAQKIAGIEIVKETEATKREKLRIFEDLVRNGANPVAVRCGMGGWGSITSDACLAVGVGFEASK